MVRPAMRSIVQSAANAAPHHEGQQQTPRYQLLNVPLRSLKRSSRPGARTSGVADATLPHNSCTAGEIGCARSPPWNSERKIGSGGAEVVCRPACEAAATGVTPRESGKLDR